MVQQVFLSGKDDVRQELARAIYKAHAEATAEGMKDRIDLTDVDFDEWYRTNANMPLSGPGFVRVWEACADAALALLAAEGEGKGGQ